MRAGLMLAGKPLGGCVGSTDGSTPRQPVQTGGMRPAPWRLAPRMRGLVTPLLLKTLLLVGLVLGGLSSAQAQQRRLPGQPATDPISWTEAVEAIAIDLALETGPLSGVIAARPYAAAAIPVAVGAAEQFSRDLLGALQRKSRLGLRVHVTDDLRQKVEQLYDEMGSGPRFDQAVQALIKETQANWELVGSVRRVGERIEVQYRLVDLETLAARAFSNWHAVDLEAAAQCAGATTLPAAADAAARYWTQRLTDRLAVIKNAFLGQEDMGVRTRFGRQVAERLVVSLVQEASDPLTGRPVRAERINLSGGDWLQFAATGSVSEALLGREPGTFLLEGSYWPRGNCTELRVWLRGLQESHSWTGVIIDVPTSAPEDSALPSALHALRTDFAGPFGLVMTSNRGDDPAYRIGDYLQFGLRLDQAAHVYCFGADDTGGLIKLFPNAFHPDNRLRGGEFLLLPDDLTPVGVAEGSKIRWPAQPPAGANVIKCFAVSAETVDRLPQSIRENTNRPVSGVAIGNLLSLFRSISDGVISEASLAVTIVD